MGQVIPKQHPSVVLRSHFKAVRALLVAALVALCALAAALVIVANGRPGSVDRTEVGHTPAEPGTPAGPGAARRHPLRRRPRRGHARPAGVPGGSGHALRRRPRRGHPRPAVLLAVVRPAVELPARPGRRHQGSRRRPHVHPDGSQPLARRRPPPRPIGPSSGRARRRSRRQRKLPAARAPARPRARGARARSRRGPRSSSPASGRSAGRAPR